MNTNDTAVLGAVKTVASIGGRIIGISHRVKQTKENKARPTLVAIREADGTMQEFKLATEQDELDFLNGQCPIKWRPVNDVTEDISGVPSHQIIFRSAREEDILVERHASQRIDKDKTVKGSAPVKTLLEVAQEVPCEWIGLHQNDTVATILGGSGDYFAFALSRKLDSMNGSVIRISAFKLKAMRGDKSKDEDAKLLAMLAAQDQTEFQKTLVRARSVIAIRNAFRGRMDVMKARIACEQRLRQHHIGLTFCSEEGHFPQGSIEKSFEERKASNAVLQALITEEKRADKALETAVEASDVYQQVFEPIPGVGPAITARIISVVVDIRKFEKPSNLVAFLGVHCRDGKFPRRRSKELANWNPEGRQALFLLGDQFNRQGAKTEWGRYLIARKAALRVKHPEVELTPEGKKRYTNGHIHKMATWRTLTRFAEKLHRDWWKLEKSVTIASSQE